MSAARVAPSSTAAFRHREFRQYWVAQLVSFMGTNMQQVALGYLVYQMTGSKWLLGVVAALTMVPSLLLGLPAGVVADRVERRRLIMGTQTSALALAFTLATLVALHDLQVWQILVISGLSGVAIAAEMPARQAFIVDLVGREDLSNAIAWNSLVMNGARVIGPAVGGIIIRYIGIAPVFYFNSISFLAVIIALVLMRLPRSRRVTSRRPMTELREGIVYLLDAPAIMLLLGFLFGVATLVMNFNVVMPIFAHDVLHQGPDGLGWMWTATGLGAVGGSITVVRWSRLAVSGPLLLGGACLAGLAEVVLAATQNLAVALGALFVLGWSTAAFTAGVNAAIQARVADALRGRVLAVYSMVFIGTGPLGNLETAGLAGVGGIQLPLLIAGILCPIGALVLAPTFLRRLRDLPDAPERASESRAG